METWSERLLPPLLLSAAAAASLEKERMQPEEQVINLPLYMHGRIDGTPPQLLF